MDCTALEGQLFAVFGQMHGDAVVIMMADESDDCRDVGALLEPAE